MDLLYLCDKKACRACSGDLCKHTLDINHAKNFEKGLKEDSYIETGHPILVLKTNVVLKQKDLKRIREELMNQIASGVIFCDAFIEPIVIDSDQCIYNVTITKETKQ